MFRLLFIYLLIGLDFVKESLNFKIPRNDDVKLILQRIEILEVNPELVTLTARVDKINKTDYALNANFSLAEDMPPMILKIGIHALFSNEYRPMPLSLSKNMCNIYQEEFKWIEEEMMKYSKVPAHCPIKKGDWYIKNFIPDSRKFPFVSPWDNIRMRLHYYEVKNSKTITILDVYLHRTK